uniref:SnoaL-like domain-containing protein n=1 Tax=OCS116 cluster bacterium TaxID=2030921 RepID=A0A2A4Z676_9PROT
MTYNSRLVDYFTSEFYQFEVTNLAHLAAPDFIFTINSSAPMKFEEFEGRRRFLFLNAAISHGEFKSTDDAHFFASVEILTLEGDRAIGEIMFNVNDDGLLQKVDVNYEFTKAEFKTFFDALFKNYPSA